MTVERNVPMAEPSDDPTGNERHSSVVATISVPVISS